MTSWPFRAFLPTSCSPRTPVHQAHTACPTYQKYCAQIPCSIYRGVLSVTFQLSVSSVMVSWFSMIIALTLSETLYVPAWTVMELVCVVAYTSFPFYKQSFPIKVNRAWLPSLTFQQMLALVFASKQLILTLLRVTAELNNNNQVQVL